MNTRESASDTFQWTIKNAFIGKSTQIYGQMRCIGLFSRAESKQWSTFVCWRKAFRRIHTRLHVHFSHYESRSFLIWYFFLLLWGTQSRKKYMNSSKRKVRVEAENEEECLSEKERERMRERTQQHWKWRKKSGRKILLCEFHFCFIYLFIYQCRRRRSIFLLSSSLLPFCAFCYIFIRFGCHRHRAVVCATTTKLVDDFESALCRV